MQTKQMHTKTCIQKPAYTLTDRNPSVLLPHMRTAIPLKRRAKLLSLLAPALLRYISSNFAHSPASLRYMHDNMT